MNQPAGSPQPHPIPTNPAIAAGRPAGYALEQRATVVVLASIKTLGMR